MIEFTKSYKTADGEVFATIDEAKRHELELALAKINLNGAPMSQLLGDVALLILTAQEDIIDILTMSPSSKPKARKLHGGTKNRKKSVITDATTSVTSVVNETLEGTTNH